MKCQSFLDAVKINISHLYITKLQLYITDLKIKTTNKDNDMENKNDKNLNSRIEIVWILCPSAESHQKLAKCLVRTVVCFRKLHVASSCFRDI